MKRQHNASEEEALLAVRVQPRASRNAVSIDADGRVRIALTAPPVEGAANKALLEFVAQRLGVRRRCVILVGGRQSRDKVIRVAGMTEAAMRARLSGGD